jgi:cytoskeletal protein RodZ
MSVLCYVTSMSSILKNKREALNLDLEQIASTLRVRQNFLVAIENEQYDEIPLEIYARGYIKVYAKYLDVPYDQAIEPYEKYLAIKSRGTESATTSHSYSPSSGNAVDSGKDFLKGRQDIQIEPRDASFDSQREKSAKPWYTRAFTVMTGLILIFVLGFVFYHFSLSDFSDRDDSKKIIVPKTQAKLPVVPQQPDKQDQPSLEGVKSETITGSQLNVPATTDLNKAADTIKENRPSDNSSGRKVEASKPSDDQTSKRKRHALVISAVEQTDIQLLIDGKDIVNISLAPGESRTLSSFKSISGVVPDSGSVRLKFDGKALPAGKPGEAISINLPKN